MESSAQLFKAHSEEVRLRILCLLMQGERCVCDLMAVLDLPQSTISRHLSYLKNAGWVTGERRGAWMYYRLAENRNEFRGQLRQLLAAHLPGTDQGAKDLEQLRSYLNRKGKHACQ